MEARWEVEATTFFGVFGMSNVSNVLNLLDVLGFLAAEVKSGATASCWKRGCACEHQAGTDKKCYRSFFHFFPFSGSNFAT